MVVRNIYSLLAVVFLSVLAIHSRYQEFQYEMLKWDVFGYYTYLPAYFIHDDVDLKGDWIDKVYEKYEPSTTMYQFYKGEEGKRIIKYPIGTAVMYTPFFLMADSEAKNSDYERDGFSRPYQKWMHIGALTYVILGLIMFAVVLRYFFDDRWTAVILLLMIVGTNYFQVNIKDASLMTHNILCFVYATFIWTMIQWHKKSSLANFLIMAVVLGVAAIIRPTTIILGLLLLLWEVPYRYTVRDKWEMLTKNKLHFALGIIVGLAIVMIQLSYWKKVAGSFLHYSYQNPAEGLDLFSPHTWNFLFSYRKGIIVYTPMVLFGFYGLYVCRKRKVPYTRALTTFLLVALWIISSWTCWWYAGGSYSSRAFVATLVVLAIPFGFGIQELWKKGKKVRWGMSIAIGLMLILNQFQSWQFRKGIIHENRMTYEYYKKIFGKTEKSPEYDQYLLVDRTKISGPELVKNENDYEVTRKHIDEFKDSKVDSVSGVFLMGGGNSFSPAYKEHYENLTDTYYAILKTSCDLYIPSGYTGELPLFVRHFDRKGGNYGYHTESFSGDIKYDDWNHFEAFYLSPEFRETSDRFVTYLWQRNDQKVLVDNFKVEVYKPKVTYE